MDKDKYSEENINHNDQDYLEDEKPRKTKGKKLKKFKHPGER